jgi:hypothetical protein
MVAQHGVLLAVEEEGWINGLLGVVEEGVGGRNA